MAPGFSYKPKFVDVRVKPPGAEAKAPPAERACDEPGCTRPAPCRAPKGRDKLEEFYWFCTDHAAEYNRRWNYFAGMTDEEFTQFRDGEMVGHRPTWTFRADAGAREASESKIWRKDGSRMYPKQAAARPEPRLGVREREALEDLGLDQRASPEDIRARYAELIKRYHPDSNGGDRSTEGRLQRVIRAVKVLKAAGIA
jgi:hypothetical protein